MEALEFRIKIMKKIILLLSIIFLNSCSLLYNASKSNKEENRRFSAQKSIRSANKNENNIDYIQAKAKVSFRDNKKMKSNTVTFRISSDEKLFGESTSTSPVSFLNSSLTSAPGLSSNHCLA